VLVLPRPAEARGSDRRDLREEEIMNAGESLTTVVAQVNAFLASAREQARDGLTWAEFGRLLVGLLHLAVAGLDAVSTLTGPEKKSVALTAAGALFDGFADRCVPVTLYPVWLILRPGTRVLILSLAAGGVEALLAISRSAPA
jgi:hypothetical protein